VRPLPALVESTAYLVVAESLANGLKHSRAERMWVRLDVVGDHLCVEIGDDGVGGAAANGGSGLSGIADRVDALGGRVRLDSPVGGGTTVRVEVPCRS
ncbi:MAG: sensor histidine kinase, partial [Ilumatobacteraceae bacterium]